MRTCAHCALRIALCIWRTWPRTCTFIILTHWIFSDPLSIHHHTIISTDLTRAYCHLELPPSRAYRHLKLIAIKYHQEDSHKRETGERQRSRQSVTCIRSGAEQATKTIQILLAAARPSRQACAGTQPAKNPNPAPAPAQHAHTSSACAHPLAGPPLTSPQTGTLKSGARCPRRRAGSGTSRAASRGTRSRGRTRGARRRTRRRARRTRRPP